MNGTDLHSLSSIFASQSAARKQERAKPIQKGISKGCASQQQFISSKYIQKMLKRGEEMYLALVRPTMGSKQGMT